jgi:outer membrane protein assembly factor BamB
MKTITSLLITVALVAGMVGCVPGPVQYDLTISSTEGGEITTPGDGTFPYDEGTTVPLVVFPHTGYRFVNWTGDVDTVADVNAASTTITVNDNYSITAHFVAQYVLTIDSTDGGKVITPGEGVFTYDKGTTVDLVAEAEGRYRFIKWTDDVDTVDDVNAMSTTMTVNGNCSIIATFEQSVSPAAAIWPKFQYDTANTGRSPYPSIVDPAIAWSYITDYCIRSSPVIANDGTIYMGSEDGKLYAINPDGTAKWSYTTWGRINAGAPAIGSEGTIYVGSVAGYSPDSQSYYMEHARLYAITPDGTLKWYFTSEGISSYDAFSPTIAPDGTIYAGADKLYAIDADGTLKWSYDTGSVAVTPALGPDGTIYVLSASDGRLYVVNPNGTLKWSYRTGATDVGNLWSSPTVGSGGTIYFGTIGDNKVYALNPDGSLKWTFQANKWIRRSPAIGPDGTVYVGEDYGHYGTPEEGFTFYAINPDGTLKWSFEPYSAVGCSASIASDGTIYFASMYRLYALNPDGSQRWLIQLGRDVHESSPALGADGTIYIGAYDGKLYSIHGEAVNE